MTQKVQETPDSGTTSFAFLGWSEVISLARGLLLVASTTTTTYDPHRGAAFPAARVIVLGVPIILLTLIYLRVKGPEK